MSSGSIGLSRSVGVSLICLATLLAGCSEPATESPAEPPTLALDVQVTGGAIRGTGR